jgi:hypothetical protein
MISGRNSGPKEVSFRRRFLFCPTDGLQFALTRNYTTSALCPFRIRLLSQQLWRSTPLCSHTNVSVPDILNLNPAIILKFSLDRFTDIASNSLHIKVYLNHLHKFSVMPLSFNNHSERGVRVWDLKFLRLWLKRLHMSRKWLRLIFYVGTKMFKKCAASIEAKLGNVWSSEIQSVK